MLLAYTKKLRPLLLVARKEASAYSANRIVGATHYFSNLSPTKPLSKRSLENEVKRSSRVFTKFLNTTKFPAIEAKPKKDSPTPLDAFTKEELEKLLVHFLQTKFFHPVACLHFFYYIAANSVNDRALSLLSKKQSSTFMRLFRQKGTEDNLKDFRIALGDAYFRDHQSPLGSQASRSMLFQFDVEDFNSTIYVCVNRGHINEAYKWYLLMSDIFRITPNAATFSLLLPNLSILKSLDQFHYVYNDMRYHSIIPSKRLMDTIVLRICQSSTQWVHTVKLIMDIVRYSEHKVPTTEEVHSTELSTNKIANGLKEGVGSSTEALTASGNKQQILTSVTLSRVLTELLEADRLKELKYIHTVLFDNRHRATSPLFHNLNMELSGLAAIRSLDQPFFQHLLQNHSSDGVNTERNSDDFEWSYAKALMSSSSLLSSEENRVPVALLVCWFLHNNQAERAVAMWNAAQSDIGSGMLCTDIVRVLATALFPSSSSSSSSSKEGDLEENMRRLPKADLSSLIIPQGLGGDSQEAMQKLAAVRATHRFLTQVLFASQEAVGATAVQGMYEKAEPLTNLSLTRPLAEQLLQLFGVLRDGNSAAMILSKCLQEEISVSSPHMDIVFRVLHRKNDHSLVLELFELLVSAQRSRSMENNGRDWEGATAEESTKSMNNVRGESEGGDVGKARREWCPAVYTTVMRSLTALGEIDTLLRLVTEELPKRGLLPTQPQILLVLNALKATSRYEEAVAFFDYAETLYATDASFLARTKKNYTKKNEEGDKHSMFAGKKKRGVKGGVRAYVETDGSIDSHKDKGVGMGWKLAHSLVTDAKIVTTLLQSCAQGRLGLDAIRVFSAREDLYLLGLAKESPGDTARDVELVVRALSNEQHVSFIPIFLESFRSFDRPFVPPERILLVALAGAVAHKQEEVVRTIIDNTLPSIGRVLPSDSSQNTAVRSISPAHGNLLGHSGFSNEHITSMVVDMHAECTEADALTFLHEIQSGLHRENADTGSS